MKLHLVTIANRHPRIPVDHARDMALHAAVALERHHASGVALQAAVLLSAQRFTVVWEPTAAGAAAMLDDNRVTELGAESLVLLLVSAVRGWTVKRRLQKGEFADWLLSDSSGLLVALETSGTVDGSAEERVKNKLDQISRCIAATTRVAGVVRFVDPRSIVEELSA